MSADGIPPGNGNSSRRSQLAKYSDLFERFIDASFLVDPEYFQIVDANEAVQRVLNADPKALFGRSLMDFCTPDERPHLAKHLRVARRRYYPRTFDCRWRTDDGRTLIMEIAACLLKLQNGDEVLQVIARDVTRAREAEEKASEYLAELKKANEKLAALSLTDDLTKLANVRHFKNELLLEHNRAQRYGTPYSVVFCDVDHFKKYNDRNGHPAGDEVLRTIGKILKSSIRATDLAARYGGEEFVVLCRGSDTLGAQVVAERIRKTVAAQPMAHAEAQPLGVVSVSVGVASFPGDAGEPDQVLKAADEALYISKESGRNRVTLATRRKSSGQAANDPGNEDSTQTPTPAPRSPDAAVAQSAHTEPGSGGVHPPTAPSGRDGERLAQVTRPRQAIAASGPAQQPAQVPAQTSAQTVGPRSAASESEQDALIPDFPEIKLSLPPEIEAGSVELREVDPESSDFLENGEEAIRRKKAG